MIRAPFERRTSSKCSQPARDQVGAQGPAEVRGSHLSQPLKIGPAKFQVAHDDLRHAQARGLPAYGLAGVDLCHNRLAVGLPDLARRERSGRRMDRKDAQDRSLRQSAFAGITRE
jgi:hypothetical protein